MNKKILLLLLIGLVLIFPVMTVITQEETPPPPAPLLEITGVNASALPIAVITANVFDILGQPLVGLRTGDFVLSGELAAEGQIVRVESVSDGNLPISAVLVIDISDSMSGFPLDSAKAAATAFINGLGENDSVAIVTFASDVRVAQDYTTDKAQLIGIIDGLQTAGRTALYSAGVVGVETVINAPSNRRVVILLSDGSEFGGASTNDRAEALALARLRGASFYTIGLGFGADRTYLEELAAGTNGVFFESPNPDQLTGIYTTIAENLRNEYIITIEAAVPLDGTAYEFGLQANIQGEVTNRATSVLVTPVPIPVITRVDDVNLDTPLTEDVQLSYLVTADDRPLTVETTFTTNGVVTPIELTLSDSTYVVNITPRDLAPGDYLSTITVTDSNGDSATLDTPFSIANIPSDVTLTGITGGQRFEGMFALDEVLSVEALVAYSQTPVTRVVFFLDGNEQITLTEAPYTLILSPSALGTKRWLLEAFVETASGQLDVVAVEFFITSIPSPTPTLPPTETPSPTPTATETLTVTPSPTATETLTVTPSPTATETPTVTPSPTVTETPSATPTEEIDVFATATFIAQQATQSALNMVSTQTARATALQGVRDIRATRIANNTATVEAATASALALATQTAIITTREARQQEITATAGANRTATAEVNNNATREAELATVMVLATETASVATQTAQADMTATREAELATVMVLATETASIATQTAQAEIEQTATVGAYVTETAVVAQANMTSTAQAVETELWQLATATAATAQAELVAQAQSIEATSTANFELTNTAQIEATATAVIESATQTAQANELITQTAESESTQIANVTATYEASLLLTATAIIESATLTAQANNDNATQTALAQPTSTLQPTLTPITELTEITAPDAPIPPQAITDFLPLICAGLAILAFLVILLVVFVRRNQE